MAGIVSVKFDEAGFEQPERPVVENPVQYELIPSGGIRWEFPVERVEPSVDEGDEAS